MSKKLFFGLFLFFGFFLIIFLESPFLLKITFLINFLIYFGISYYNIFIEKDFSPFISVFVVFGLLFFVISPIIQIDGILSDSSSKYSFPQNFPFNEEICIKANFYIFLFNVFFFLMYLRLKRLFVLKTQKEHSYSNIPFYLLLVLGICLFVIIFNINSIIFQYQNSFYLESEVTTVANYMITQKFLYVLPLSGIVLSLHYIKSAKIKSINYNYVYFFLFFLIFLIFFLKNPLTEKRNALGPLYITLIFLFFKNLLSNNFKVFKFMFIAMIVFFPVVSIFTHATFSISEMVRKPSLIKNTFENVKLYDGFKSLHYDAYSNFLATIDYCDNKTTVIGEQLLCSVFFFVPRSLWESKPETTGFLIGNYLINKYKFTFNNLSNPYISEGYINFGFLGIFLFALILAFIFVKMINWLKSNDVLKSFFAFYFAIYLIFFLRGDLTNGVAFLFAFWLATFIFPKIFFLLINYYANQSKSS